MEIGGKMKQDTFKTEISYITNTVKKMQKL